MNQAKVEYKQAELASEERRDTKEERLIKEIWKCIVFEHPLPGMFVLGMGPAQIAKANEVLQKYLDSEEIERDKKNGY